MTSEDRVWTVPSVISAGRLLGVAPLLWTAYTGRRPAFLALMVVLLASDWVDGKLAILLDQRSTFGARLDSAADAVMYAAIVISLAWLEGDVVWAHRAGFLGVGASWGASAAVALLRFGRLPSYHTWGAKVAWLAAAASAVLLLVTGAEAPVPWFLGFVVLVNLEAVAIGLVLPHWRADVPTLLRAWRLRRGSE